MKIFYGVFDFFKWSEKRIPSWIHSDDGSPVTHIDIYMYVRVVKGPGYV